MAFLYLFCFWLLPDRFNGKDINMLYRLADDLKKVIFFVDSSFIIITSSSIFFRTSKILI